MAYRRRAYTHTHISLRKSTGVCACACARVYERSAVQAPKPVEEDEKRLDDGGGDDAVGTGLGSNLHCVYILFVVRTYRVIGMLPTYYVRYYYMLYTRRTIPCCSAACVYVAAGTPLVYIMTLCTRTHEMLA